MKAISVIASTYLILAAPPVKANVDRGGWTEDYIYRANHAKSRVVIPYSCMSACVILLSSRHGACLQHGGAVYVHSPYIGVLADYKNPYDAMSESGQAETRKYYAKLPKAVFDRLSPLLNEPYLSKVENEELISLGMKACTHVQNQRSTEAPF